MMHDLNEGDVRHLVTTSNLDSDSTLNAVCKAMGVRLLVTRSPGVDHWIATPPSSPDFSGSRAQVVAWVCGYAAAWLHGRAKLRKLASDVEHVAKQGAEQV